MANAIIIVGYNRLISLKRLLTSLNNAEYCGDNVTLIISLDKSEIQNQLIVLSNGFVWKHGKKKIRAFSERQGLRQHILNCGELTSEYDGVIILEDDLTVSSGFYAYAKQAMDFYGNDARIAGISLYKHLINLGSHQPFEPGNNGYDTFLMQFAQSWGQCWTKSMWIFFKTWYNSNYDKDIHLDNIPEYILQWDEKSWLKYYMEYIVATNKFFVYPQVALSTNHSDAGTHCDDDNNDYQVPLLEGSKKYRFPPFDEAVKYDAFFERIDILEKIPFGKGKIICLDLYGKKKIFTNAEILISTAPHHYRVVKKIQLKYRPHEINCLFPTEGDDIFVYDLRYVDIAPLKKHYSKSRYDMKTIHWTEALRYGIVGLYKAITKRIGLLFIYLLCKDK